MALPDKRATDRSSLLSRLDGVVGLDLVVTSTSARTPSLFEVAVRSDQLRGLAVEPGQDVMVDVPVEGGQHVRRRYTMVDVNGEAGTMSLLIAVKGTGAGEQWAKQLQPGDIIDAVGPRGKQPVNRDATHHLFVADHSAFGATSQMVRSITSGRVHVVIGFPTTHDVQALAPGSDDVKLSVEELAPVDHGDVAPFLQAISRLQDDVLHAQALQCYLNAEFSIINQVRALLTERGVPASAIATKPYWRRNLSNAPHGEPIKD